MTVLIKKRLLKGRCQNLSKNINTFKESLNMLFINKTTKHLTNFLSSITLKIIFALQSTIKLPRKGLYEFINSA